MVYIVFSQKLLIIIDEMLLISCDKLLGKPPDDGVRLSALNVKPSMKIMMMGTREENLVIYANINLKKMSECQPSVPKGRH